jgi:hypothetical protein
VKYRGLAYNRAEERFYYVYGLPSYGFNTDEIAEIGTPDGDFIDINPATLGKATGYHDKTGKEIYTGDITELKVDGEIRRFEVVETILNREYNALSGFKEKTVKVQLQGVIAFRWVLQDGQEYYLLPCVDDKGVCDTEKMKIVGDIHTSAERGSRV